jgi:hypothetical protein
MIIEIGGLALLVAVGAFLITPMIRTGRRQARQARWPRVRGEVTAHQVRTSGDTGFPEYRVRYRFERRDFDRFVGSADGAGHTAYRDYDVQKAVEKRMSRLPPGSSIEIMVNPADPDEAYIVERELPARAIAFVTASIFLLFFLVFFFIAFD